MFSKEQILNHKKKIQLIVSGTAITIMVGSCIYFGTRDNSYSVMVDGKVVAVVKTKEEINQAYQEVVAALKEQAGVDIMVNEKVELEAIHSSQKDIDQYETLVDALSQTISYQVQAYEILADGVSCAVVSSEAEANKVLEQIATDYLPRTGSLTLSQDQTESSALGTTQDVEAEQMTTPEAESESGFDEESGSDQESQNKENENMESSSNTEIVQVEDALPSEEVAHIVKVESIELEEEEEPASGAGQKIDRDVQSFDFNEEVIIRSAYVEKESILDEQAAKAALEKMKYEIIDYTLVEGDNTWDVAMQHGTTVERILELNPEIVDETKLQIGQQIKVEKAMPLLSITTIEESTYKQMIPTEIQYVVFSHLYEGETQVYQEGSDGLKEVTVSVTKVNGKEVSRELVSETVLSEPVIKVIGYGIKEKPVEVVKPNTSTGNSTNSSTSSSSNNSSGSTNNSSNHSNSNSSTSNSTSSNSSNSNSNSSTSNSNSKFIHPLKGSGYLSSGYGSRWGSFHKGNDYAAPAGTPIYASAAGKVIYSGYNSGGYGNLVIIDHNNGYQTYYAHCSKLYVNVGDSVGKGERIAGVGSTGNSTGNHLHFEIRKNGTPVNPSNYI